MVLAFAVIACTGWLLSGCGPVRPPAPEPRLQVEGKVISIQEIALELRSLLWRRSQVWAQLDDAAKAALRREAIEGRVEAALLTGWAAHPPHAVKVSAEQAEAAFQAFIRQFEPPDGWKKRLELQGLTEAQLRDQLSAELAQTLAIESWLKVEKAKAATELDEAAAQKWFAAHREQMRLPERVRASHFFLTAHDRQKPDRTMEMAEYHRQLLAGETILQQLAAKFSDDERSKKTGGQLGWLSRDRVPQDLADVLFALPMGKTSPVFRTKLGWHIAVVHEKKPPRLPEFAEVRDEVVAMLENEWRAKAVDRLRKDLRAAAQVRQDEGFAGTVEPANF